MEILSTLDEYIACEKCGDALRAELLRKTIEFALSGDCEVSMQLKGNIVVFERTRRKFLFFTKKERAGYYDPTQKKLDFVL